MANFNNTMLATMCLFFLATPNLANSKTLTAQQQNCVQELSTYKNKAGKQAVANSKITTVCKKQSGDSFLSCVGGTERFLQGVDQAIGFCSKNHNAQARSCVQGLGAFKKANGQQEMKGSKIAAACQKNNNQAYLDCVTQIERPLNGVDRAVNFCAKKPKDQVKKCVREMADYKDSKGKPLFTPASLAPTCEKNSSTAYMDCVAKTKKPSMCGKSSTSDRLPASNKTKKPTYLPKKKKIAV